MNETWIAIAAGAGWLAAFTAALFAFSAYVQRRDKHNRADGASCWIPLTKDELRALETVAKTRGLSTTECAQLALGAGLRDMQDGLVLSEKGAKQLIELIENPTPPTPKYLAAKERHARIKAKGQSQAQRDKET